MQAVASGTEVLYKTEWKTAISDHYKTFLHIGQHYRIPVEERKRSHKIKVSGREGILPEHIVQGQVRRRDHCPSLDLPGGTSGPDHTYG